MRVWHPRPVANVFLVGIGAPDAEHVAARAAIDGWRAEHTLFNATPVESWTAPSGDAVALWTSHPPEQVGGVRYAAADGGRLALFNGRPFAWTDTAEADGRSCLDARFYLRDPAAWMHGLDGGAVVVRIADGTVDAYTDVHGMQPLYLARSGATTWLSNAAPLLYRLVGTGSVRDDALAWFLTVGWGVTGQPLWHNVERLPRGRLLSFSGGAADSQPVGPETDLAALFAGRADFGEAARILVAASGALADWDGRPNMIPVTGGRDSRLVAAAATAAGVRFQPTTVAFPHVAGYPDTPDVVVARRVCAALGLTLEVSDPVQAVYDDPMRVLRAMSHRSPGTQSLADATTLQLDRVDEPLPIVHLGLGGEYARAFYGSGRGLDRTSLPAALLDRISSWRGGILNGRAREIVLAWMRTFVAEHLDAGVRVEDVPDAFYVHRVANWASTSALLPSSRQDAVMPLMSRRLLPHELGLSLEERAQEVFHLEMLRRLAPALVELPFEGTKPYWPSMRSPLRRRVDKALIVARRKRAALRRRAQGPGNDPFGNVLRFTRDLVDAQPDHPAWGFLDDSRVRALLAHEGSPLDAPSQQQVWRLATVFGQ